MEYNKDAINTYLRLTDNGRIKDMGGREKSQQLFNREVCYIGTQKRRFIIFQSGGNFGPHRKY